MSRQRKGCIEKVIIKNYGLSESKVDVYLYGSALTIGETGYAIMCTIRQVNIISEQMKECYRSIYGGDVVEIILYGSYARGDYSSESDIDIVAIVKGDRLELQKKLKTIWEMSAEIGLENDVIVSPMVIPYDEFLRYRKVLPYYRNIVEEGKRIG